MKVAAHIPIKLNNERLPNKNLKCFDDGTPMCHLVFNTLSEVEEIDEIYCYCSNPKIQEYLTGRIKFYSEVNLLTRRKLGAAISLKPFQTTLMRILSFYLT